MHIINCKFNEVLTDSNTDKIRFRISISIAILFVAVMWIVKIFELTLNLSFVEFGVYPMTLSGLKGILFSPFIHGSLKHIFSNTFPMIILFSALLYFYPKKSYLIFAIIYFASGIILWIIGRSSYHIGASGLIYALAAFHFFSGVLSKRKEFIAISLIVVFLYGGIVWGLFPGGDEKISWEGHLAGFAVGTLLSVIYHPKSDISNQKLSELDFKINYVYFYGFDNTSASFDDYYYYKYVENEEDEEKSENY